MILDQENQIEDHPKLFQFLPWGRFVMYTLFLDLTDRFGDSNKCNKVGNHHRIMMESSWEISAFKIRYEGK